MSDGGLPKFPTNDVRTLQAQSERNAPPDRWADRVRHAWLTYLLLTVGLVAWVAVLLIVLDVGHPAYVLFVLPLPAALYARIYISKYFNEHRPGGEDDWKL